jgi:hypothetical protein
MKKILRSTVIAAASVASILSIPHGKEHSRQKKQRTPTHSKRTAKAPPTGGSGGLDGKKPTEPKEPAPIPLATIIPAPVVAGPPKPPPPCADEPEVITDRYPWKRDIVTTVFWIGERPSKNNPVPNRSSAWDREWAAHYGGTDIPERSARTEFRPAAFVPGQNPFYVALPYNDLQTNGHKPEAKKVVPWFDEEFRAPGQSVCKGRWIAIRFKGRTAYAQWEDCGPFRTDHHEYVFGKERPRKNLNKGAGLDVSPAVRDYLGMDDTDVTDWKFVDFDEVPHGPWAKYGDNNTFVINERLRQRRLAAVTPKKKGVAE